MSLSVDALEVALKCGVAVEVDVVGVAAMLGIPVENGVMVPTPTVVAIMRLPLRKVLRGPEVVKRIVPIVSHSKASETLPEALLHESHEIPLKVSVGGIRPP